MNTQEKTDEVRELTANDLDEVNGGFVWIAAFVGGAAGRYGPGGGEALYRYFAH